MKRKIALGVVILALVGAMIVGTVQAQGPRPAGRPGGPGGPGGAMPPGPPPGPRLTMEVGTSGLFVLAGPALVKYDAATLEQAATIQLCKQKKDDNGNPLPPPPAEMLLAKAGGTEQILVVAGDEFVRVDAASFEVAVRTELPEAAAPADDQSDRPKPVPRPVELKVVGNTLYMIRGPQILAVNIINGQTTGQGELPPPPGQH